jgi:putative proteasome-type protease
MTYCLGIKVREGLVCLSDGRITSGNQVTNARKVSLHGLDGPRICVMTSGLRSLPDGPWIDRLVPQGAGPRLTMISED